MRYPLVIGNWKLNGNKQMLFKFIVTLNNILKNFIGCNIVIAPPTTYLSLAREYLGDNSQIAIGAQNIDIHLFGAFTGEISAEMLKDIGVQYIIIGHYERRLYHKERNEFIAKKFSISKALDLTPVLCIGESKDEHENDQTEIVCANQVDVILNTLGATAFNNAVIAYEPVWAIGTGKAATPLQIQTIHKFIRNHIAKRDTSVAEQVIIQYGGSVNANNVEELLKYPDIDGVLVGSAALQAEGFSLIIKKVAEMKKVFNYFK